MNFKKGLFITFEGSDGSGKSTQIEKTLEYLTEKGFDVILTREPGGTKISEKIREILLDSKNKEMFFETEALLYAAARAQHVRELIEPALDSGVMVICDRFVDSSLAYQGYARGLGIEKVEEINSVAIGNTLPDITFLLELSAKVAIERRQLSSELDRIEICGEELMVEVEKGYRIIAKKYSNRIVPIDARGAQEEVFERIKTEIDKKIIF